MDSLRPKKRDIKISSLLEDLSILEDYAQDLFNFSPLPVCLISPVGVILEANPAFEKISGSEIDGIIGEPAERFFEKDQIKALTTDILKGKREIIEGREIKFLPQGKQSMVVHVFAKARNDQSGETVGYFLGFFNLTEIKNAEKELKKTQKALLNILEDTKGAKDRAEQEKEKTQAIITNFTDGLLVFDRKYRLILINPKAESFLNVGGKKIYGKSLLELAKISECKSLIKLLGNTIEDIFRKELDMGEEFVLEVSAISLKKEAEGFGYLVILHDISREKIIERLKTEFVSISAHQLRTPLSAIKWTLKMLLDGDLGGITAEQREFLNRTYDSNERMINLINSLLNVSRIEEGRFVYKPVFVNLAAMTKSLLDDYQEMIKQKGVIIKFIKPSKPLPKVFADKEKIGLAIQNLIDNAIRYTPAGKKVIISLRRVKDEVEFNIKDEGVGIPKKQQNRIFTKFFRGTNVVKLDTDGSGLGLFITKNIIKAHKGKIWFESKQRKGSTFRFTLPTKTTPKE